MTSWEKEENEMQKANTRDRYFIGIGLLILKYKKENKVIMLFLLYITIIV
ncbi:hypothetical protein THALO_180235 [Tenacibaculum halocynthiae]